MDMKYLKCAKPTHKDFNGHIGRYRFENGVSAEKINRRERDRMAAAMEFEEIDDDGNIIPAGGAYRMIALSAAGAPTMPAFDRQTEEEKSQEKISLTPLLSAVPPIYTKEELDAVADKSGISGVREVAAHWDVKHRSIVVLMQMILDSQATWLENDENKRRAKQAALNKEQEAQSPERDRETAGKLADALEAEVAGDVQVEVENEDILAAAASGDMAAALSETVVTEPEPTPEPVVTKRPILSVKKAE